MLHGDLVERWTDEAERYERDEALVRGDALLRRVVEECKAAWERYQAEKLTLADASTESGYSPDHLGRLVREGTLPNAGEKNSPLIRRCNLPRKPGHGSQNGAPVRSRSEMARSVVTPEGGHDG